MIRGRFAPSPTGYMHIGNVWSALGSWLFAKQKGGQWILRVEDIDHQRSKAVYEEAIREDLTWLGFHWDAYYIQSKREERYERALRILDKKGLLYPCYCSRARLHQISSAPHEGEPCFLYDRHCYGSKEKQVGRTPSLRVHVPDEVISFTDRIWGYTEQNLEYTCGDYVVKRSDGLYSYQLAVVVDDGENGVTQVVRGADLLSSVGQQIWLGQKLGFETPEFVHLPLWQDKNGHRLSKRQQGITIRALREKGYTSAEILGMIAVMGRLIPSYRPIALEELTAVAELDHMGTDPILWDERWVDETI